MSGRNHPTFSTAAEMLAVAMIGAALLGPAAAEEGAPAASPDAQTEVDASAHAATPHEDVSKLLPLLLSSPERKQIAEGLAAAIRQGDLQAAETHLNAAIEMGTLAIVLIDRLHDPNLLSTLQTLGIHGDVSPTPAPDAGEIAVTACNAENPLGTSNLHELQEALDREQAHSSAVSQELAELTEEYGSLASLRESEAEAVQSKASELQEALQQEQERRSSMAARLESLQDEYRTLQALKEENASSAQSRIAELESKVQQEQERSEAATRQIAGMQEELRALQELKEKDVASVSSRITELQDALAREKIRGDAVTQELANAIEELRVVQEQEAQDASATPLMFRLEADGVRAPLPSVQEETLLQAPQLLLVAETTPSRPVVEPAAQPAAVNAAAAPAPLPDASPVATASLPPSSPPAPPQAGPPPAFAGADDRLTQRADELFHKGDISGARLLLERSMEDGNPRAAFLLAETFDPHVLSRLGALGIRGDAAKARELYAKARALGITQAGERIEALRR